MEQTKALNALAPFLALTKSATSPRAAADLIIRATSAPNTFIFAELLESPQFQTLSASPDTPPEFFTHLTLLKLFSYGTYTDYNATPGLPALNEAQTLKLRQLSFLTLAKNPANLSYTNLLGSLGLETARELEDLVISTIYAGLITATLDPYHQHVLVSSVSPLRDLQPNSIPAMIDTLNEWSLRCTSTLEDLEKQIASIKAQALKRHKEEIEWAAQVEELCNKSKDGKEREKSIDDPTKSGEGGRFSGMGKRLGFAAKRGSGNLDGDDGDDMDVDEEDDDEKRAASRSSKKRGFGNMLGGFGKK